MKASPRCGWKTERCFGVTEIPEYCLDGMRMQTRQEAHAELQRVMQFPDWYGRNLDALYDLLTERGPALLKIRNASAMEQMGPYGARLLDTIRDAARDNPRLKLQIENS